MVVTGNYGFLVHSAFFPVYSFPPHWSWESPHGFQAETKTERSKGAIPFLCRVVYVQDSVFAKAVCQRAINDGREERSDT